MRFAIHHRTVYRFERPVFLEPHHFRLIPRQDPTQEVQDFTLHMDPEPAGIWRGLDTESQPFAQAWFDGLHQELAITTRSTVHTLRDNPYGFLLQDSALALPPLLDAHESQALAPCLARPDAPPRDQDAVLALARDVLAQGPATPLDFMTRLNTWLFEHLEKIARHEPGVLAPAETLAASAGSCRDTAFLFMDCCRCLGIPARFVSGYQEGDPDEPYRDLHAWAEAFLPGAGWLGLDPTHGLLVAGSHVALAASYDPARTAPVLGTYRGTGVESTLEHEVRIKALS